MRDQVNRAILLQAALAVGVGVALFWLASLLPVICPGVTGGGYCGPELRRQAAASSTLLVVAVGIAAVAAAMSVPANRRRRAFGWGALVLCAVIGVGIAWIVVSAGFFVI
jgi:hypothetical protein